MATSRVKLALLGATVASLLPVALAIAQPPDQANPDHASLELGPWLVGVNAGMVFPLATGYTGAGNLGGLNVRAAGNLNFKAGPTFTGFASYEINRFVATAGQLGYATTRYDDFQGTLSVVGLGNISGKFPVRGDSDIVYGFIDGIVTPLGGGRTASFVPLLGAGIGFASTGSTFTSIALPGVTVPVGISSQDTELALVALAGIDYRISERAYLGLGYQFVWINGGPFGASSAFPGRTGAQRANIGTVLFEYRF
jgi:opacity protein-like surface antigen